ncbi:hypothetical protein [Paenibacillus naphthalenovorans]|uniref:hypothetical protein n=1 Tax=Paenibacillus naphthalenovorans TaxID=162209 RepID=UPI003D2D0AF9
MEFIHAIKSYQADGNRYIIDRIHRHLLETDFLKYKSTDFPEAEMYIAFRIMRIIGGRLATIKYALTDEGYIEPTRELESYSFHVQRSIGVKISPDDGFEDLRRNAEAVRQFLTPNGYEVLMYEIERYFHEPNLKRDTKHAIINDLYFPLILPALEYALSCVNTDRTEREIVRYVNRVFRTKYYQIQIEAKGLRRVRRKNKDGEVKAKYVAPRDTSVEYAILGPGTSVNFSRLTESQRKRYETIWQIVEADLKRGNYTDYSVDNNGLYRIKNRQLAAKVGMHEVSFSRWLAAVRKRLC